MTAPTPCSCMGPMRGDPYCYCEMLRRGLEPTRISLEEKAKLEMVLDKMFGLTGQPTDKDKP